MFRTVAMFLAVSLAFVAGRSASALEIGDPAPEFKATGIDGQQYTLETVSKDADLVVLCFTCNQCPVAVSYEDRFIEFNKMYEGKKVTFVALNCNNASESLEAMKARAEEKSLYSSMLASWRKQRD